MFSLVPINPDLISKSPALGSLSPSLKQTEDSSSEPELMSCDFQFVLAPFYKMVPSFFSHRLEADLLLYDRPQLNERGESRGLLSNFNSCKRILSATFDSLTGLTSVRLENSSNTLFTPYELMVARLDSQGDKNAHKLALKVQKMGQFINNARETCGFTGVGLRKSQRTDKRFRNYQTKIREITRDNVESPIIGFQFKFSKRSNDFETSELFFNEKFSEVIGFESNIDFSKSLLKKGFPDAVFIDENYHNWYSRMVNNSFVRLIDNKMPKEPMQVLIQAAHCDKELYDMEVEMSKVELEGYIEITMHLILNKPKTDPNSKRRRPETPKSKTMVFEPKEQEETMKDSVFVKKFYPDALVKKRRMVPRECGFRIL